MHRMHIYKYKDFISKIFLLFIPSREKISLHRDLVVLADAFDAFDALGFSAGFSPEGVPQKNPSSLE